MMNWFKRLFFRKKKRKVIIRNSDNKNIISFNELKVVPDLELLEEKYKGNSKVVTDSTSSVWYLTSNDIEKLPSSIIEHFKSVDRNNFEREYLQPEYTDEDRCIDDTQDKGIYSYPVGISEEREIHQSWIDDSYNSPTDSTSYDSSSSYDDSSTSSGDW